MVINQFHSIGDIIFCEPIFRYYWNKNGEKPIVPVRDHLIWLANYIESARFVKMSEFKLDYDSMETSNPDYLPLRFANQIIRGLAKDDHSDFENMMLDKYRLCGLDEVSWKTIKLNFIGDLPSEMYQFKDDFHLINENCQAGKIEIKKRKGDIVITEIPGKSIIDWWQLLHFAEENHHVSTCTFFIMQAIYNQFGYDGKFYVYPRPNEDGLRGISQLNPDFELIRVENQCNYL